MCGFCLHLYDIFLKLRLDVSQKNSPEKFKVFADVVMQGYGKRGISAEGLIQEQIAKAKKNGREIDYDAAYEEMIADSMEGILADGKALAKLKVLQERDTSLWEAVKNWAKDVAGKIRAIVDAYKDERMDSREGKVVANMREILPQLEDLYAEGLADTRGEAVTDSDAGTKKAAQDGGVKYQARTSGYDFSKSFEEQVDDFKKGLFPKKDTLLIGGTPDVFQKVGFNSLPMTINRTHVDWALNNTRDADHYVGESNLKQLPDAIKNPVAIFVSQTQSGTSVVALLPFTTNGKQTVAPVLDDGFGLNNGIMIDSNAVTSIFGKTNSVTKLLAEAVKDEAAGKISMLYWNKKEATSLLQQAGLQLPGLLMPRDGFIHSIRESASPVKVKFDDVTESQQFKRWFGDWKNHPNTASKVVNADGTPKILYHQTSENFTIFDPQHEGAGTRDSDTPFGIFMKSTDKNIGLEGEKQMVLYARIVNPLEVRNREELVNKLKSISPAYVEASEELRNLNAEYQKKFDDAKEAWRKYMVEWRKEHPDASRTALYDDEQFNKLFSAEDDVIDEWEVEARKIETRCKEAITKDLEANGYDGVIIQQDKGSFGRSTDAYIALRPEQVKSATDNIGTFDGQNPDIRYSDRDPDAVKVNQILQKQNAELRETVGYLKELVKLQGKVTDGTVYTRGSVEAAARKLIRGANAKGDVVQLQRILEKTYRAMGEGSDSMMGLIDEAAQWLVDHKRPEAPKLDGYAQTILSDIRGRSIRLNDSQKAEASYLIGNFTDYRRRLFGTLNITDKAGTGLDQFWQEMSTLYPDVFQPDISSADMPRALYDAVDSLKSMYEVQTFSPEEMAEAAINEQRMNVWESFTGFVPIKTVADRNKVQVETVKKRYRTNTGAV